MFQVSELALEVKDTMCRVEIRVEGRRNPMTKVEVEWGEGGWETCSEWQKAEPQVVQLANDS